MDRNDSAQETREWLDALNSVQTFEGVERVDSLLSDVVTEARKNGANLPFAWNTAYINTIPPSAQPEPPGTRAIETKIRAAIRWNAAAIVLKANKVSSELGGHIASFQSAATLYDVGFMHFWRAPSENHAGDLVFIQGHSSPGIYARAFLEGRISEEQILNFRQEVDGKGLSSYPHPWLMPDFWQFPTVSMGLGPLMAIYQARFLRYLEGRGLIETHERKVWAFMGDGEMDEPESLGAISLAGREKLDNLIFVINCNLQRLDGPVRGNGKIIQELEADFRGSGWNVIKLVWGAGWDELLAKDVTGRLRQLMEECVDGEYQDFKSKNGTYIREKFFGRYPETAAMVADWSDEKIWTLTRGGHDFAEDICGLQGGFRAQGPADADPGENRQGLWHGRGRRSADDVASGQENEPRRAEEIPRPLQNSSRGQRDRASAAHKVPGWFGGGQLPARRAEKARRLSAGATPTVGPPRHSAAFRL